MRIALGVMCMGCIALSFLFLESLRQDLETQVVTHAPSSRDRAPQTQGVLEIVAAPTSTTPIASGAKSVIPERESREPVREIPVSGAQTPSEEVYASVWKKAKATTFWVGEDATTENGFIHNSASAWDGEWERHFGGIDDPKARCGYYPCAFTPQQNPFYVALPYNDLDDMGYQKANAARVPWFEAREKGSILKNRWIEVRRNGISCFGEWQDVGPFEEDDIEYVFGEALLPKNTTLVGAGIDLSPALSDCVGLGGLGDVEWRHVDEARVPDGPWKEIVTRS